MTEQHWSEWREHTPGPCPYPAGVEAEVESLSAISGARITSGVLEPGSGDFGVDNECWLARFPGEKIGRYRCAQIIRTRFREYPDAFEQIRQLAEDPHKMVEVV